MTDGVTPRAVPMTLDEMRAVLNQDSGHTLTEAACPVCRMPNGCLKRPQEEPKEGPTPSMSIPQGSGTVDDGSGVGASFKGVQQLATPALLVGKEKFVPLEPGHKPVVVQRETRNQVHRMLRGAMLHPATLSTHAGQFQFGVADLDDAGGVPVGSNQVVLSLSEEQRQYLIQAINRGYPEQSVEGSKRLVALEAAFKASGSDL